MASHEMSEGFGGLQLRDKFAAAALPTTSEIEVSDPTLRETHAQELRTACPRCRMTFCSCSQESGSMPAATNGEASKRLTVLVRHLAHIAAERDYEAQRRPGRPPALKPFEGEMP